jgi:uncharacterized protein
VITDFHTHIVPPRVKNNRSAYLGDPLFGAFYSSPKAKLATAEDLLSDMERDEVDLSVALNIGWSSQALCAETNDYLMECVAKYPRQIAAFGSVNLGERDSALREIERCARGGLLGIGEMRLSRQWFEEEGGRTLPEFARTLDQNGMGLIVHSSEPVGHQYVGKGDTTPELIYRLIVQCPDLPLVCAHWGGGLPFYGLMPEVKQAMERVLFDTAASPYLYTSQIYPLAFQIVGSGSILFGSDYPLLRASRLLKEIRSVSLEARDEEAILSGNAAHLFSRLKALKGTKD